MLINTGITIDGTNITDYVGFQGITWRRTDKEGANAGTTLSGLTIRDRIATKVSLGIACRELNSTELQTLMNLLLPEYVEVTYTDPMQGLVTKTMYTPANEASLMNAKPSAATEYWTGVSFELTER